MKGLIFGILIGAIFGVSGFFILNYFQAPEPMPNSVQAKINEKETLESISKLIIVPQGEIPVIATITNAVSLIKDQPFYKGSINGDVVVIFQKAAKAIVYSPSRNIIVNVGPVLPQEGTKVTTTATSTKKK